jgi:DNA-directed RNA polymerase specialized sigma24 family protein
VDLTDGDIVATHMKISEKVLHLRRLGMTYASIAERLGVNLWMAKRAARLGKAHQEKRKRSSF